MTCVSQRIIEQGAGAALPLPISSFPSLTLARLLLVQDDLHRVRVVCPRDGVRQQADGADDARHRPGLRASPRTQAAFHKARWGSGGVEKKSEGGGGLEKGRRQTKETGMTDW